MELTQAQYEKLDSMPDDVRVIAADRQCPLVERNGRVLRILPRGQLAVATREAILHIEGRRAGLRCSPQVTILGERL